MSQSAVPHVVVRDASSVKVRRVSIVMPRSDSRYMSAASY